MFRSLIKEFSTLRIPRDIMDTEVGKHSLVNAIVAELRKAWSKMRDTFLDVAFAVSR